MRTPDFATTKQFRAGFLSGLFLFLAANIRSYWQNPCWYEEGRCGFGFPFEWGYGFVFGPKILRAARWGYPFDEEIYLGWLAADIFAAAAAGVILGLLCNKLFKATAFK